MKLGCSYFGNRNFDTVKKELYSLRNKGFNAILHTFTENDQKYYLEAMQKIVRFSKKIGFEVYVNPWGVGQVFGGEAFSLFTSLYPEANQRNDAGEILPTACFNNEIFQDFMKQWIKDAVSLDTDYIFWDEPHWFIDRLFTKKFKSGKACFCESCNKKFHKEYNKNISLATDEELKKFREESLFDFLKEMTKYVKSFGKKNTICLLPYENNWDKIDNWERYAELHSCDMIATDPYWICFRQDLEPFVSRYSEKIYNLTQKYDVEGQLWVQGFRIPTGKEEEINKAFEIIKDSGIDNVFVWGYKACDSMSFLKSGDNKKVWSVILENIYRLSDEVNSNFSADYEGLKNLVSILRSPKGCDWDKDQNINNITTFILEECYELLEEVHNKDYPKIIEELGDIMMLLIFAIIILEEKEIDAEKNIFNYIIEKMIRRHPHVFDNKKTDNVVKTYNEAKKKEYKDRTSVLDGIPHSMPSMALGKKVIERAAEVGFKWKNAEDAFKKIEEEFYELREALEENKEERIFEEWGDLWFAMLNFSYIYSINPEEVLKSTVKKFISRFQYVEEKVKAMNKQIEDLPLQSLIELWKEGKKN